MQSSPTIAPAGSAINGSTVIPQIGRSIRSTTATSGPMIAEPMDGSPIGCVLTFIDFSSFATFPLRLFFARKVQIITVPTSPTSAGMIPAAISAERSTPKFSAAAIVFGFGEMTIPAFSPPIKAARRMKLLHPIL